MIPPHPPNHPMWRSTAHRSPRNVRLIGGDSIPLGIVQIHCNRIDVRPFFGLAHVQSRRRPKKRPQETQPLEKPNIPSKYHNISPNTLNILPNTHPPLKVDRMRHGPTKPTNCHKTVQFGSAVRRPLDKCTGGETGPRKRFPLVPRPSEAKKRPKTAKIQNLPPITNGSKILDLL